MATVFETIRPVPPITTIFMGYPACRRFKAATLAKISVDFRTDVNTEAVGLVQLNSATLGEFAVPAAENVSIERRRRDAEVTPMPGLASLALVASMSSPLRPGDWFLVVTTIGA